MKRPYLALLLTLVLPCNLFAQTITTFAGTGIAGYSGNGGPATAAKFSRPTGLALDASRNLYIADGPNYRIRKISPTGTVTLVAGTGTAGYTGDGGPATAARIGGLDTANTVAPLCIAVNNGNIYIADGSHHVIRKIDAAGIITTIAGTGTAGFSGDNGAATAAKLRYPQGISFDTSGNLYVADCYNHRVRKISPAGVITTFAGSGTAGYTGNGGPATAARLRFPYDAHMNGTDDNLYIADLENNVIRKVDASGTISTFAGTTVAGFTGDDGPATAAQLDHPTVVRVDGMGNVYVSDNHHSYVRRINAGSIISAFAGNTTSGYSGDDGPATAAQLKAPWGLAVDNDEFVYISDSANARIRKVAFIAPIMGSPTVCIDATTTMSDSTVGGLWSINDTTATIDAVTGDVTGIYLGTATITYTTSEGRAVKEITIIGATLSSPTQMTPVCSGDSVLYTPASTTSGTTFTWQRNYVAGISSLSNSGSGNVAEMFINTTTTAKTVTYIYTLTSPGCINTENVRVSIRPVARLSSSKNPPATCDSALFAYNPSSFSSNVRYAWSRSVTPGISNPAAADSNAISEILNSTVSVPVSVKYVYTLITGGMGGGCTNTDTVIATVNPCHPASVGASPDDMAGTTDLYPNPASGHFIVTYHGIVKDRMEVSVYNITGKLQQTYVTGNNSLEISLTGYAPGVYYCQIVTDGQKTVKKLVVN